jgi:hypothetical protein
MKRSSKISYLLKATILIIVILAIIVPSSSISINSKQNTNTLIMQLDEDKNDCDCTVRTDDDCISDACFADIVFVVDISWSMGDYDPPTDLDVVKDAIQNIIDGLDELFEEDNRDFRVGGISYTTEVIEKLQLSEQYGNHTAFLTWLEWLAAVPGTSECPNLALNEVLQFIIFNEDAEKIVVFCTDEGLSGSHCSGGAPDFEQIVTDYQTEGIITFIITGPTEDEYDDLLGNCGKRYSIEQYPNPVEDPIQIKYNISDLVQCGRYILSTNVDGPGFIIIDPDLLEFPGGTIVTLDAIPDGDDDFWCFQNWSGEVPIGHEYDNPLVITMDGDKSITAHFIDNCPWDVYGHDGMVTPQDAGIVKFYYGSNDTDDLARYDINDDGSIDPQDVGLIKYYYGPCPTC